MIATVGHEWDHRPEPGWQDRLESVYPRQDHLSWMKLAWEPGDPWQPIERWVIWQMLPARYTHPDILRELRGPHPRSTGHYCGEGRDRYGNPWCRCRDNHRFNRWRDGASRLIDRRQWELYQETGCYGTRWWVIQGEHGGHRHRLDAIEGQIAKLHGAPPDTPAPGDLPYAPFDDRVFWKVAELDRVRAWKMAKSYTAKDKQDAAERFSGELAAKEQQAGDLLWGWLRSQVDKTYDAVPRAGWKALAEAAPRIPGMHDYSDLDATREMVASQSM